MFPITAPSGTWVATHPWGAMHPLVVVTDASGQEVLPDVFYEPGQVTVKFSCPTSGSIELIEQRIAFVASPKGSLGRPEHRGRLGSTTRGAMA